MRGRVRDALSFEDYMNEVEPFFLEFNELLISALGNRFFESFTKLHSGRLNVLDAKASFAQGRPWLAVQEHRQILAAIQRGDVEIAAKECHNHLLNVFSAIEQAHNGKGTEVVPEEPKPE